MSQDAYFGAPLGNRDANSQSDPQNTVSSLRDKIARIWETILDCPPLSDTDTFFDAGGDSLQLFEARTQMEKLIGQRISVTQLFETPKLGALAKALDAKLANVAQTENGTADNQTQVISSDIAIVGLSGKFPKSKSVTDFWEKLCAGEDLISRFENDEMEDTVTPEARAKDNYLAVRPILDDVDMFDAKYLALLRFVE